MFLLATALLTFIIGGGLAAIECERRAARGAGTEVASICPHCGFDLAQDEPASRAGISMLPYGEVRFHGAAVKLTKAETGVLWALMKADQPLPRSVLAERIGYEGDGNCVDVLLCRIRRKLAPHGAVPIRNRRGAGVYIEG